MRLRYTRRASIDLARIVQYLNERSPQGARKVQARIHELINLTLEHPYAGTRTRKKRVRRLVAYPYPYLIFYEATDDHITVLASDTQRGSRCQRWVDVGVGSARSWTFAFLQVSDQFLVTFPSCAAIALAN